MIAHHEDELACDLAETYHIFDLRELPLRKMATLACGLSRDSRVMLAMAGQKLSLSETLICLAIDRLSYLIWMQSEDGRHGRNRPKSILEEITKDNSKPDYRTFRTSADFEAARKKIIGG